MIGIPEITIEAVIARYGVLLFDAYGVLVDAASPLAGAVELLRKLNRLGKPYYILTNDASQLPLTAARKYHAYGLAVDPERFVTSGELLTPHFADHHLAGARCVVLGPADTAQYVELAGGRPVALGNPFEVLVMGDDAGFPLRDTMDALLTALFRKFDRQEAVQLVLPNPDLIYPAGEHRFRMASGSLALILEAALQLRYPGRPDLRFARLGKPSSAIFAEALRRSGTRDMVMLGDQLETDIRGANDFGLDSVLVTTGVTASTIPSLLDHPRPTYWLRSLTPSG
ncbi:MAG TPA: HAD hydrolase-like protein [Candidatus Methylomirabilis sp.]